MMDMNGQFVSVKINCENSEQMKDIGYAIDKIFKNDPDKDLITLDCENNQNYVYLSYDYKNGGLSSGEFLAKLFALPRTE